MASNGQRVYFVYFENGYGECTSEKVINSAELREKIASQEHSYL